MLQLVVSVGLHLVTVTSFAQGQNAWSCSFNPQEILKGKRKRKVFDLMAYFFQSLTAV